MAKVEIEVLYGVIDGSKKGAKISIEDKSAKSLSEEGLVKILPKPKAKTAKKETASKKQTKATKDKADETPSNKKATKDE